MQFERRVLQSSTPDGEVIIIGVFLFLLWSGFRWSDMQRTAPSTLQWSGTELRGLAWRTKTSSAGCPFGFISCGFLSHGTFSWTLRFLQTLDQMLASENLDSIDFLIPSFHRDGSIRIPIQAMTMENAKQYAQLQPIQLYPAWLEEHDAELGVAVINQ